MFYLGSWPCSGQLQACRANKLLCAWAGLLPALRSLRPWGSSHGFGAALPRASAQLPVPLLEQQVELKAADRAAMSRQPEILQVLTELSSSRRAVCPCSFLAWFTNK